MLRRTEGYFLVEMLLSLATWLVFTGFLLPMIVLLSKQAELVKLENTANHLLYDELERHIDEGVSSGSKIIVLNGTSYEVRWSSEMSPKKVCVEYHDDEANIQEKCQSPE